MCADIRMSPREFKKILLVTDLWSTHPNGVATVVRNLKKEIEKKGCAVDILESSQFFTIPLPLYPEMQLAIFARRSVRKKIQNGGYDAIHIETEGPLGLYARGACLRLGIPFTTSLHGQHHLYAKVWLGNLFGYVVRRYTAWFHAPALCTMVSTSAVQEQMHALGLRRVYVRPLGVEESFFTRGVCPLDLEKPVFMYMGRVSSEKSIDEFLLADLPGTKLVVGNGPEKKRLEKRFPKAKFVGSQEAARLIAWCSCADVMVMPSRTETFGLTMVECLALGIPVAAHDVTGPREIVQNGLNGFLDEDIAQAAKKCLTLSRDACRESARKYTWSASADTFLSIVERANASRA